MLNVETMWRFKIAFNLFYMALDRQNAGTSSKVLTHLYNKHSQHICIALHIAHKIDLI